MVDDEKKIMIKIIIRRMLKLPKPILLLLLGIIIAYVQNSERTNFFSVLVLISLASVKNASSTFAPVFALVSKNLIPCSTANSSPLSFDTCE